ncbi:hypothetical protein SAY86_017784 [Trapa natans]|uniref:Stomatal closure-related actin-binding protein actin-binding domain-containing protein n=1 Tax=Trapa natans TaxID=22666 RepID=A0AAN7M6U6_TRANT|nr:hypothetical protein SAY86_017784 [Trapa natans]
MQTEAVLPVSVDVSFASNFFPKYKLGPDNQIFEELKKEDKGPSLKEVVEQHKHLSVHDLASKFDKNLTAAAKLSIEVMNMEQELHALKIQIQEKAIFSFKLQKELILSKMAEENRSRLYILMEATKMSFQGTAPPTRNSAHSFLATARIPTTRVSWARARRTLQRLYDHWDTLLDR